MKRTFVSFIVLLLAISVLEVACTSVPTSTKDGKCSVNVHVDNVPDTTYAKVAWLHQNEDIFDIEEIDSIPVINGQFSFECAIERLTSASICIDENYMRIYLEPGEIEVNLDGATPYLVSQSGTSVDEELDAVNNYLLENSKRSYNDCFNQFGGYCYHTERYDLIEHRKTIKQRQTLLLNFCRSHMDYKIVPDLLHQVMLLYDYILLSAQQIGKYYSVIQDIYQDIPSENKNSDFYEMVGWEIKQMIRTATASEHIGEAPDFQCKTTDGKQLRLYSYIDESFVLLHFGGDMHHESRKLSDYYNIPGLKIISITQDCMPDDEKVFSQFVQGRWPIIISDHDFSYYGMRLLHPVMLYEFFPLCARYILISPNRTIVGRWKWKDMPDAEEVERAMRES